MSIGTASGIQKTIVDALVLGEGHPKAVNSTNPYLYKVRKNSKEFRRLALLHPLSQWRLKCFYQKYEQLILHYCAQSPASIRSPRKKVAGSFYSKSSWENINQYKKDAITLASLDRYVKHTPRCSSRILVTTGCTSSSIRETTSRLRSSFPY